VTLKEQLEALFANPPASRAACAKAWADAMQAYAAKIVPPSTTVPAAALVFASALTAAFGKTNSVADIESAFTVFATSVGGGMIGYAPVPPVAPVGFAALFSSAPPTHALAAQQLADLIHAWLITGTSALISPASPPAPWS
jgi:hypothetical protein